MATKYLSTYIISLITFSIFTYAFIMLIDPYYVNNTKLIKGLNALKPEAYTHKIAAKRSLFLSGQYKTMILGNSRADVGFNPLSENWPKQFGPTFNFGLPGAILERNLTNYYFATKKDRSPTNVILLIDFYNFIVPHKSKTLKVGDEKIHPWIDGSFSLPALQDAIMTIYSQHVLNPAGMNTSGFNAALPYNDMIRTEGHYNLTQHSNQRTVNTYLTKKNKRNNSTIKKKFDLHLLTKFAKDLSSKEIQLYVVFPPYHLDLHTIIEQTELSALFYDWKNSVIKAVSAGSKTAQIWDFATKNYVTNEAIPGKGDNDSKMKWYWEPGHFKSTVGDLIGCELIKLNCPSNIGQRIPLKSKINFILSTPSSQIINNSLLRVREVMR